MMSKLHTFRYKYLNGPIPKVSSSSIAVMYSGQFLSGSQAARELDYEPEVSLREAIRRTYAAILCAVEAALSSSSAVRN
jgi:nucleoside-diphosphate-sugar epimerase